MNSLPPGFKLQRPGANPAAPSPVSAGTTAAEPPAGFKVQRPGSVPAAAPAAPITAPTGFTGNFGQGFERTLPQTRELLGAAQIGIGQLVGSEGITQGGVERFEEAGKETQALAGPSFADVREGKAGVGEYVGDVLGNFGGQAVQSAAAALVGAGIGAATGSAVPVAGTVAGGLTGAVAGIVGRKAAMTIAKEQAKDFIKSQVEKGVALKIAEKGGEAITRAAALKAAKTVGAVAAPFAINAGQEVGSAVSNRINDGTAAQDITPGQAAQAIAFGTAAGVVDTATEAFNAGNLYRALKGTKKAGKDAMYDAAGKYIGPGLAARVAGEAAMGGLREGGTEIVQSALERAGGGLELGSGEALNEYVEAGVAGVIGGVALGGPAGIRRPRFEAAKPGSLSDAGNAVDEATNPPAGSAGDDTTGTPPGAPPSIVQPGSNPATTPPDTALADAIKAAGDPADHVIPAPWVNAETGELGLPTSREQLVGHLAAQIGFQIDNKQSARIDANLLAELWGINAEAIRNARGDALKLLTAEQGKGKAESAAADREQQQSELEAIIKRPGSTPQTPEPGTPDMFADTQGDDVATREQALAEESEQEVSSDRDSQPAIGQETPITEPAEAVDGGGTGDVSVAGPGSSVQRGVEGGTETETGAQALQEGGPARADEQVAQEESSGEGNQQPDVVPGQASAAADVRADQAPADAVAPAKEPEGDGAPAPVRAEQGEAEATAGVEPTAAPEREGVSGLGQEAPGVVTQRADTGGAVQPGSVPSIAPAAVNNQPGEQPSGVQPEATGLRADSLGPVTQHKTTKGKTIEGYVRNFTAEQARNIDPYTFRKGDGWFIRSKHSEALSKFEGIAADKKAAADAAATPAVAKQQAAKNPASQWAHTTYEVLNADPIKPDDAPLSPADADFDLEVMLAQAEAGKFKPENFAQSAYAARLSTNNIMAVNKALRDDAVGTLRALRAALPETTPPAADITKADAAANEAATSPTNDRPEPTQAQKEAGNYAKGHIRLNGLDVTIENPAGTSRQPEWPPLTHHYGYIKQTEGADAEQIDVFLGPKPEDASLPVFVIDQKNPKTGKFDEHKVMLGFATGREARAAYKGNYAKGWKGFDKITAMSLDEFRAWVKTDAAKKPAAEAAVKGDKAEIRPYRKPDGTVGYEAVPTIDSPKESKADDGQQDELDAEMQAYEAKAAAKEKPAKRTSLEGPRVVDNSAAKKGEHIVENGGGQALAAFHIKRGAAHNVTYIEKSAEARAASDAAIAAFLSEAGKPKASVNTIFTEDAAEAARKLLRAKLGQLNNGLDPEIVQAGITLAGYHIEKGARTFAAYSKAMLDDLGEMVRPYLKSWYMGVKYDPRMAAYADEMSGEKEIDTHNSDMSAKALPTAEVATVAIPQQDEYPRMPPEKIMPAPAKGARVIMQRVAGPVISQEEADARIQTWKDRAKEIGRTQDNSNKVVFSLFDRTGGWSQPYVDAGYDVRTYDIENGDDLMAFFPMADILEAQDAGKEIVGVLAAPPCTSFATSGARWWADRHDAPNKEWLEKTYGAWATEYFDTPLDYANTLVAITQAFIEFANPSEFHVAENPVGRIAEQNQLPDALLTFDPNHFGNPYTKKTLLWGDFKTDLPTAHVEAVDGSAMHKMGSGDKRRSITPDGFAYAFFMANHGEAAAVESTTEQEDTAPKEAANERASTDIADPQALGPVAPAEDRGAEGRGDVGSSDTERSNRSESGSAGSDGARVSGARSAGSGAKKPRAAGSGAKRKGAKKPADGAGREGTGAPEGDEVVATPAAPNIPTQNFEITDDVGLGKGGEVAKFNDNLAAIKVLKQIESENRRATPEEQAILARYVGWGGLANAFAAPGSGEFKEKWAARGQELADLLTPAELAAARKSTPNAHFTSQSVVSGMWRALERLGFKGGSVLEPSVGTGNFVGLAPKHLGGNTKFLGVEMDSLSARIAGALYPQAAILHSPFQKVPLADNSFDAAIGNPPFGPESLRFQYKPEINGQSIHNQFFMATLDALKPDGVMAMVVSRYLMDKKDPSARMALARKADLIGAIRLPDTAFKENARTEVVTDILFFKKHSAAQLAAREAESELPAKDRPPEVMPAWTKVTTVPDPLGGDPIEVNAYFAANPDMILGTLERSGSMRFENDITVRPDADMDMAAAIDKAAANLPKDLINKSQDAIQASLDRFNGMADSLHVALSGAEAGGIELTKDGKLVQVIERETPEGEYELTRRTLTAASPWSPNLYMDDQGRWFRLVEKVDAEGKKVKQVDAQGKPTRLNAYGREVFEKESDVPARLAIGKAGLERLKAMASLRDLLKDQLTLEATDAPKKQLDANRKKLADEYEAFQSANGLLNEPANARLVAEMPDGALILALEHNYRPGEKGRPASAKPAPILSTRVVVPYAAPTKAAGAADALAITLAETGSVDMARIASLLGTDEQGAIDALYTNLDKPLAFLDPEEARWVDRNEYLTGLVKRKLAAAKANGLTRHVEALEAVQPKPWTADQVTPTIGSTWIPPEHYAAFAEHLTGGEARAHFSPLTNTFSLQVKGENRAKAADWGVVDESGRTIVTATDMLDDMLNSKSTVVSHRDRDGKTHIDQIATAQAQLKRKALSVEFSDWVFADSQRRDQLVDIFNDKFNIRTSRQHDGSHLTLPGKVPDSVIKMRRHQNNAIWRGIAERFMLIDHVVGAGKTFTAIARAMERRRMGLARKPVITVPNHLVEQWAADVYKLYPGAKVLAAGTKDFEKRRRRKLFAKIATGDWDIVILPHSSFGFIGIAPETEQRYLEGEIALATRAIAEAQEAADEEGGGGWGKPLGVKEAERLKDKLEARLDGLKKRGTDKLLTFEQMGIDDLTVDEAHEFKNLFYSSRQQGVRGMGNKTGSAKAFDLYNKVRVLRESPTGAVTFMTGTPISNSAVEMYSMMRYLAADQLAEAGLDHFDSWRAQYVDAEPAFEPTETGGLKEVTRLGRNWSNMRALMDSYGSFTDSVSAEDIEKWYAEDNDGAPFPIPKVKDGGRRMIALPATPAQQAILNEVIRRFNNLPNIKDPKQRNAERLRAMDQARKIALDPRAAGGTTTDNDAGGKLERVSNEVYTTYKAWDAEKGTQVVFLDRSVPKSKGDDQALKDYDALVVRHKRAEAEGDEAAAQRAADQLEKFNANEMEEMRSAQAGGWNAYQQIKDNLVARGIPANEIRFIQEATNDAQKKALFDAVKAGEVRVLIGSTQRMGAGTNVQDRLVGLHHVDVTWKPSDIEQREGRIIRQGNLFATPGTDMYRPGFEVQILAYATERTIDAKMWDLNAQKLKTINGIRKYDGEFTMEFEDEESVSMAEMAALASGDPLLMERVKLTSQIDKLEMLERGHRRRMYGLQSRRDAAQRTIDTAPDQIENYKPVSEQLKRERKAILDRFADRKVVIEGETYTSVADAKKALNDEIESLRAADEKAKISLVINGKRVTSQSAAIEAVESAMGDSAVFEATVGKETFGRRGDAARAIAEEIKSGDIDGKVVGKLYGYDLVADVSTDRDGKYSAGLSLVNAAGKTLLSTDGKYQADRAFTTQYVRSMVSYLSDAAAEDWAAARVSSLERSVREAKETLPEVEAQVGKPFAQAEELAEKRARLEEVVSTLSSKDANPDSTPDEEGDSIDLDSVREGETTYGDTYPISGDRQRGGVAAPRAKADRTAAAVSPGQVDMFVAPSQKVTPEIKAELAQRAKLVETGRFKTGIDRITRWEDAAHIIAPLRKSAQEQFLAVVADADGKPLAVIRHTIGLIDQSAVEPGLVFGAIAQVKGAKQVWFAHNHPSGITLQSASDRNITMKLDALMRRSGIKTNGMIVVAPGTSSASLYDPSGPGFTEATSSITPAARTKDVQQLERSLRKVTPAGPKRAAITSPTATMEWAESVGKETGVLLLDNRHQIIGFMPMAAKDMELLRTDNPETGSAAVMRLVTEGNAAAVIIKSDTKKQARNIGGLLADAGIRVLDAVVPVNGKNESMATAGEQIVSGAAFFSLPPAGKAPKANNSPAHTLALTKAIAEVVRTWGANRPPVRVLRTAEDLPAAAKAHPRYREGRGVFHNNTVYLVAPNLTDTQHALVTLAHEAVGHYGIEATLNDHVKGGWDKLTADIARLLDNPSLASASIRGVLADVNKRYAGADATTKAKETIAIMAERGLRNGLIGRVVAAIKALLRKWMPGIRFADADLRRLLAKSEAFLNASPSSYNAPAGAKPAFSQNAPDRRVRFDAKAGVGATPDTMDADYFGYEVQMRPSEFLRLATPRSEAPSDWLRSKMESGAPVAPPVLYVNFRDGIPTVTHHEGRGRAMLAREFDGDNPIPVKILGANGLRARSITPEMREAFRAKAISETGKPVSNTYSADTPAFSLPAGIWYSALAKSIRDAKGAPKAADATTWKQWLDGRQRDGALKADERNWLGVDAWLDEQPSKITRADLAEYVAANEVQVSETVLDDVVADAVSDQLNLWMGDNLSYESLEDGPDFIEVGDMLEDEAARYDDVGNAAEAARHQAMADEARELAAAPTAGPTKFPSYVLPGGSNYRELLITLPGNTTSKQDVRAQLENLQTRMFEADEAGDQAESARLLAEARRLSAQNNNATLQDLPADGTNTFRSSHFDQPNILAHIRFNERSSEWSEADRARYEDLRARHLKSFMALSTAEHDELTKLIDDLDAGVKRTLFIEEIQSDWHQDGRKRGYKGDGIAEAEAAVAAARKRYDDAAKLGKVPDDIAAEWDWAVFALRDLRLENERMVPDAPFKTTWPMLAFKRAVRWAAENGFDRVAWTTGEQQAARYDLSKQVHHVTIARKEGDSYDVYAYKSASHSVPVVKELGKTAEQVAAILGKDLAEKAEQLKPNSKQTYSGLDLKVGGKGMRAFYDKMLPNEVNKFGKKFGARVATTKINRGAETDLADNGDLIPVTETVHSIDITPEMRASVMDGQALFSLPPPSMEFLEAVSTDPDATHAKKLKDLIRGKAEDLRPAALGALQLRHLMELAEDHEALRGSRTFADMAQQMSTDRQMLMVGSPDFAENPTSMLDKGVAPIAEQWAKFERKPGLAGWLGKKNPEARVLTNVMHDATQEGLDPSKDYERLTLRNSRGEEVPWTKELIHERIKELRGQMRGRSGDDKAPMIEEIKYMRKLPARERKRVNAWPSLVARYQALSPEAKNIYRDVRDWYKAHRQAVHEALLDRIDALELPEQQKRQMKDTLRLQFESQEVQGVYFPLDRNGEYWVSVIDKDGEQGYKMYETATEFAAGVKDLRRRGYDIAASGRKDMDYKAKNAPSGTFVADIMQPLIKSGAPDKVMDEIYQIFLKSLPEMSMRKRNVHRKAIPGYSDDALRAFAKNGFHGSHQLTKLRFGHRLEAATLAMQKSLDNFRKTHDLKPGTVNPFDVTNGDTLLGEIKRRLDWIMDPKDTNLANKATSIGFLYYLGASPAAALVNLTQGAQVTLPVLGAKYGWPKAMAALGAATRDSMRSGGHIIKTLTSDEERMAHRVMEKRGDFDRTQQHTLAGLAEGNELRSNPAWAKTMNVIGYLFHKAEVVNRESAGIAAFRLARAEGQSFEQATQYASDIINGTHFDYSSANRPRYMQGNIAKVALQFKNYSVGMTWMLYRNLYQSIKGQDAETRRLARRTLTGILGMTSLFAGVMGLPMINIAKLAANAAHAAFGDDDEPWDFDTEFRAWLAEHFGGEVGKVIADGPTNRLGVDLASRVKLSDLWFRDSDRELEGRDAYYQMLESIAGPMGGLVKNFYVGQQQIADGKIWRGVETMLPKFAKDAMKGMRYAHEGVNSLRGDPIVPDVSAGQTLAQAIGFRPAQVADQQRLNNALKNYEQHIQDRRATLINAYAMAIQQNSPEGRTTALSKMQAFNTKFPEIAISAETIRKSMRTRAQFSEKADHGIVVNQKLGARVREAVGAGL